MKALLLAIAIVSFGWTASADIKPEFEGKFQFQPEKMHKDPIQATLTLLVESTDATLKKVTMKTDKPVMGTTDFESVDQAGASVVLKDGVVQLSAAFKLNKAMHKWVFVMVTNKTTDASTYTGTLYRVNSDVASVTPIIQAGVSTVPSDWKALTPIEVVDLNP